MQTRAFNSISVNTYKGLITKSSENVLKLKDEINYYLNLPDDVLELFPKLIDYNKDFSSYTIEYIPYKSLSEVIITGQISFDEGKNILDKLFDILSAIHTTKSNILDLSQSNINFLVQKTIDRINMLERDQLLSELVHNDSVLINDKIYKTFKHYQEEFINILSKFFEQNPINTIIHGDFSFSNILYCPETKDIKLIDPRGSFGKKGIYGHPYYDYAKLMHCIHGNYDHIVNGKFELTEKSNSFSFHICSSPLLEQLYIYFKNSLNNRKLEVEIIHLIESSLFLSMASLHYEDIKRQKALFLNGLINMNNFFERNYENMY